MTVIVVAEEVDVAVGEETPVLITEATIEVSEAEEAIKVKAPMVEKEVRVLKPVLFVTRTTRLPSVTRGGPKLLSKRNCLLKLSVCLRRSVLGVWNLVISPTIVSVKRMLGVRVAVISACTSA